MDPHLKLRTLPRLKTALMACTFLVFASLSRAEEYSAGPSSIISGHAMVPPVTIERTVRKLVAQSLKGHFLGDNVNFETDGFQQSIALEPNGLLKDILATLGMKSPILIKVDPIQTQISFPEDSLKLAVKALSENTFSVHARWGINQLSVSSKSLRLQVPRGLFDQEFEIVSTPVSFGLTQKSVPISIELGLTAELTEKGTSIHLNKLETNILSDDVHFYADLGPLSVNDESLQLDVLSNGINLHADERSIRKEFKQLEPAFLRTIKSKLNQIIEDRFATASREIENAPPFHFVLESNTLIQGIKGGDPEKNKIVHDLLSDIKIDLLFSYLQYVKRYNLFTTQIASSICIQASCLKNIAEQSKIGMEDMKTMGPGADVGIIAYESMLQTFIHSETFQQRILKYYEGHQSAGVSIAKSGVKVHLSPEKNAAVLVLNLDIDIRKTAKPGSSAGQRLRLEIAKWIEKRFGSGKSVTIPVEITAFIQGIHADAKGNHFLSVKTELPFRKDGTITNTYHYPSNVEEMTSWVKKDFLKSVEDSIAPSIPASIEIPLGKGVELQDFKFTPEQMRITPNHGLMITWKMKD